MFRAVKYVSMGSAPVIAFGMVKVEASEPPQERRLVKPKDLPLYREEKQEWEFQAEDLEANAFESGVTTVRQQVWKMTDACQGAIDTTKHVYHTVEKTSQDIITYIKTEEGFYPRAGVIGIAGLTGIVLARKGGLFRKMIYSGGLMAATASLCYPYKAVQLSQAEYEWVRDKLTERYKVRVPAKQGTTSTEVKTSEEKSESKSDEENVKAEEKETAPSTVTDKQDPQKDFGQSNPADKDMYTTRS